jgi:4-hydroxy-4-methyl-2-oxoglutarate aldolase
VVTQLYVDGVEMTKLPAGIERLFSAVISDALDAAGEMHQAFPHTIRPLDPDLVMVGRARTAIYREVVHVPEGHNPYALEIQLVDSLQAGEIAVMACGGSSQIAPWGGLLSTAAKYRGAAGCVTDGFVRDIKTIRSLEFPVYHAGIAPLDSKGRGEIVAIDQPVRCGGVLVSSGDLVFGDADGVVVIPRRLEDEVIGAALKKVDSEDATTDALKSGVSLADVFARFKVL